MQTIPIKVLENSVTVPMSVAENGVAIGIDVEQVRIIYDDLPAYEGDYNVTPAHIGQTLRTNGKRMTDDLTVAPIPQNYGLITWNGAFLTIS